MAVTPGRCPRALCRRPAIHSARACFRRNRPPSQRRSQQEAQSPGQHRERPGAPRYYRRHLITSIDLCVSRLAPAVPLPLYLVILPVLASHKRCYQQPSTIVMLVAETFAGATVGARPDKPRCSSSSRGHRPSADNRQWRTHGLPRVTRLPRNGSGRLTKPCAPLPVFLSRNAGEGWWPQLSCAEVDRHLVGMERLLAADEPGAALETMNDRQRSATWKASTLFNGL